MLASPGRNQENFLGEAKPMVGHNLPTPLIEVLKVTYLEI